MACVVMSIVIFLGLCFRFTSCAVPSILISDLTGIDASCLCKCHESFCALVGSCLATSRCLASSEVKPHNLRCRSPAFLAPVCIGYAIASGSVCQFLVVGGKLMLSVTRHPASQSSSLAIPIQGLFLMYGVLSLCCKSY